ncbi:MAG: 50S ribosomal protein L29 [Parcubacteria group bacterium]|nr:50S ribosomal protein L29 [Parcubacteria group bacterium]
MKIAELKSKSREELKKLLVDLRGELVHLRFKIHSQGYKNVREIRCVKKDIARVLTFINLSR